MGEGAVNEAMKDALLVFLLALVLYGATMLPGPAWGPGAELALVTATDGEYEASPLFVIPARIFVALFPFGNPAWRLNLFVAIVSALVIAVMYLSARLVVVTPTSAFAAAAALGTSYAFYSQAVLPSVFPVVLLFIAIMIHFQLKHVIAGGRRNAGYALAAGLAACMVHSSVAPAFILSNVYLLARQKAPKIPIRIFMGAGALAAMTMNNLGIVGFFIAFEYPFVAWVLIGYGAIQSYRRFQFVLEIVLCLMIGTAFARIDTALPDLVGPLLPAAMGASLLLGMGADFLMERIRLRHERLPTLAPALLSLVIVFPLLTMGILTWYVRASGVDQGLARNHPGMLLKITPWKDPVYYALWPPKNGQGGASFIDEVEALPDSAAIVLDPELLPVVEYAQVAESRLLDVDVISGLKEFQLDEARMAAARGKRIFLAGTDPNFYDLERFGTAGEIVAFGRMYEWQARSGGVAPAPEDR